MSLMCFNHSACKPLWFSPSAHASRTKCEVKFLDPRNASGASRKRRSIPCQWHPSDRHVVGQSGDSRRVLSVALPFAEISDPNYNRGVEKPNV